MLPYLLINWTTLICLLLLLVTSYGYFKKIHSYWERRGIAYEKPVFLAGSLWDVFSGKRQIGKHLGDLYKKYAADPYFGIYVCGKPYLVLRSPEIIKRITIRDFSNFDDRTFACDKSADDMTGNSLFVIRNPDWRNIRYKLSTIFTTGKLKNMYPFMTDKSLEMVKFLARRDGDILEIKDVAGKYMTDLVAKCFFGLENNSFAEKPDSDFRKVCIRLFDLDMYRSFCMFSYFFLPKFVSLLKLKLLDTVYLRDLFLNTLRLRETSGLRRNDFVDLLIDVRDAFQGDTKKGNFDTTCMVAQAITFFVAGFETTSNLLAFTLYELSLRPDCQEELRREISKVFGDDRGTPITFDKIQQMQYLDMVMAETLRRYPFGPFLNRNCKEDYVVKETGFKIEKGTPVLIPLDGIHFDPTYYKDPEKFEPERFRDGYKHLLNSCVYMPFGLGPRNCIGDRFGQICAKVGLVHVLRNFAVEKCHLTPDPLVLNPKSPFMTPMNGLRLRVKRVCTS